MIPEPESLWVRCGPKKALKLFKKGKIRGIFWVGSNNADYAERMAKIHQLDRSEWALVDGDCPFDPEVFQ